MNRVIRTLLTASLSFVARIMRAYSARVTANGGVVEATACATSTLTSLDSKSLLQSATFVLAPSGYKSGIIYSQVPSNGNGDLTVTRATSATRVNSSGVIETVASGVPQLDYSLGGCPVLLFEPQRTNLVWNSDWAGSAAGTPGSAPTNWSFPFSGGSMSLVNSIYGTASQALKFDVSAARHFVAFSLTTVANTTYVMSVYVEAFTGSFTLSQIFGEASGLAGTSKTYYDAQGNSLGAGGANINATGRYYMVYSNTAGGNILARFGLGISGSQTGSITLSRPMVEQGSSTSAAFPTSYIPTPLGGTATRNAGNVTRSNIYTNALIGASGGTWLVEVKNNIVYTRDTIGGLYIGDNSVFNSGNYIRLASGGAGIRMVFIKTSGSILYTTLTDTFKAVVKWNGSSLDIFVNGIKVATDNTFSTTNMEFFGLSPLDIPRYIAQMALWNSPLTEAQCLALTSNYYTNLAVAKAYLDAHIARVNADGGTFNMSVYDQAWNYVSQLMGLYGTDLTNVPIAIDPHYFGYKTGTGSGVTANGNAAGKLYNLTGVSGDFVQGTPANQPLLLRHTGENYWWNGGVVSNYCSTPNATANQITGDIDIRVRASFNSLSTVMTLISKLRSGAFSYMLRQTGAGALQFTFSLDGTNNITVLSTVAHPFSANQIGWFRVTRTAATGQVIFYTSTDGTNWTQLGSTVSSTSGSIFNSTTQVEVGSYNLGITDMFSGTIYRAQIYNGINGTLAVDFNPSSYNAATSTTQWTSATGEVWTINTGTASTGYKGALVDRTQVQSDASDDYIISSNLTFGGQKIGQYSVAKVLNNVTSLNVFTTLGGSTTAPKSFYVANSNTGATSRQIGVAITDGSTINRANSGSSPFGTAPSKSQILSTEFDTSLDFSNEIKAYANGSLVANSSATDQTFSFDIAYPVYLFSLDATQRYSNMVLTSLIITKDVTKRTDVELIIRNMNNNFAF